MFSISKLIKASILSTFIFGNVANISPVFAQSTSGQSSQAKQVDRRYNLSFEYRGCQRANTRVTCDVVVTNFSDINRQVSFGASFPDYRTNVLDSAGNLYTSSSIQTNSYQQGKDKALINLAPGIPTKLTFNFRIPIQITELTALDLGYRNITQIDTFGRITIPNIGNISTTTAAQNK
ncbi:hypothetical protein [Calothrix sp. PCC 6303]|uniref:hypothetical protein n=1 Tax=Calothrix sp. PCC 6303 TaxID=1170562 RepID=UPI0002A015EF|nr:hypothetical protein [Calothrix sp. PCC 6303]AFZ03291.1 hypothetical protein Cal6303_4385 [Calothrix sp. PCC 6303]